MPRHQRVHARLQLIKPGDDEVRGELRFEMPSAQQRDVMRKQAAIAVLAVLGGALMLSTHRAEVRQGVGYTCIAWTARSFTSTWSTSCSSRTQRIRAETSVQSRE